MNLKTPSPKISQASSFFEHAPKDEDLPYIQRLKKLQHAYPALKSFLGRLEEDNDEGRKLVQKAYWERWQRLPGRCALLIFHENHVEHREFLKSEELDAYLGAVLNEKQCRLWILEDLAPDWFDVLGTRLKVDPLVISEQINTWNFVDSSSIPYRALPSMVKPQKSFTLRYYEFRQLTDNKDVDMMGNQMTFTVNRRRYERWRDVDTPTMPSKWRHALVRRSAGFWTNQGREGEPWDGRSPHEAV